ncbi:MAG: hypothetical protein HYZ47_04535 [Simkania negevensis]|nr:hypothetical protein [Simkania negevensis]
MSSKKLLILFIPLFLFGAFLSLKTMQKSDRIEVISNNRTKRFDPPFGNTPQLEKELHKRGYKAEWSLLKQVPNGWDFLRTLKFFFIEKQKTRFFLFHDVPYFIPKYKLEEIPLEKKVLILWEPPVVLPGQYKKKTLGRFNTVLTWNDDLVDGKKFFKFHYPSLRPMLSSLPSFFERKLLCMIASNKLFYQGTTELYSERRKVAGFFESQPGLIDIYGPLWDGYLNAKGSIPDKAAVLKNYKFAICFENCITPGYITEKIFDAFAVGTLPVYWGAPNIEEYIPKNCFIDFREFSGMEELLTFLQNMKQETYQEYLTNIKSYLESKEAKKFSPEALSDSLLYALKAQHLL